MESEQEKLGKALLNSKKAFRPGIKLHEIHDFYLGGGMIIATPDVFKNENGAISANGKQ